MFLYDVWKKFLSVDNFENGLPDWLSQRDRNKCIDYYQKGYEILFTETSIKVILLNGNQITWFIDMVPKYQTIE